MVALNAGCRRGVSLANFMTYATPSLHPDRVMGEHDAVYVVEGEWEIWQDSQPYLTKAGDVLFLAAGRHHYGLRACAPGLRTMFVHMSADALDAPSRDGARGFLCFNTLVHCAANPRVRRCFENIIGTYWSDESEKDVRLAAHVDLLLCELACAGRAGSGAYSARIRELQRLVSLRHDENLTAEAMADAVGMSARSIRYYFKKETGVALHQYQMDIRLDMAFRLLQSEPTRTLRDIAATFGFYDEYHFSRLFKRRFGYPPGRLRRGL